VQAINEAVLTPVNEVCEECRGIVIAVGYRAPGFRAGKKLTELSTIRTLHEPWCKWQIELTRLAVEAHRSGMKQHAEYVPYGVPQQF